MSVAGARTAEGVVVTACLLRVVRDDGRELSAPLELYPRPHDATASQRTNWRLIGRGEGIHWPDIDEDVSVRGLLRGR